MALDFSPITSQPSVAERFFAGQREAQQNALAQQQLQQSQLQTQMTRMQFEQAQKDRAALDNMAKLFAEQGHTGSLDENFDKMIASGIPQYVQIGISGKQKLAEQAQFARIMGGGAPAGAAPAAAMPTGAPAMTPAPAESSAVRNALGLAAAPTAAPAAPVNALAAPAAPVSDTDARIRALQDKETALLSLGTPQAIAAANAITNQIKTLQTQHVVAPGGALVGPGGQVLYRAEEKTPTATAVTEYNFAKTPEGGGFKGSFQDFLTARARAGATPAQPQPPVAVVDPATGKTVYVTREEALSKRMTPASAMEGLSPKEIQKREAALPQATSAVKSIESNADTFVKDLQALRNHPGLSQITGFVAGRAPGITGEGRAAQALFDKVVAKGGFQMLQSMRDASKTGGALGNVSNKDVSLLQSSFAAIDRKQNAPDVRAAIDAAISEIQGAKVRAREAYNDTYSYKQGGEAAPMPAAAPAAAPASAKPTVSNW